MKEAKMGSLGDKIYENPVKKEKLGESGRISTKKDKKKRNEK